MYYGTPCYVLLVLLVYAIYLLLLSASVSSLLGYHAHAVGVLMLSTMLLVLHAMHYAGVLHCWCIVLLLVYCVAASLLVLLVLASYVSVPVSVSGSLGLWVSVSIC